MELAQLNESGVELRKPNALIALRPTVGKLTTVGRKVFNALLAQMQAVLLNQDSEAVRLGEWEFEAPLRSILRDAGLATTGGGAVKDAARYLEEMHTVTVDWLQITPSDRVPGEKVHVDKSGLLYRATVKERDGVLFLSWIAPKEIIAALASKEILWTRLHLERISKLKSYAAVALYEICSRYKTHVSGLTSRHSVDWWTDSLSRAAAGSERREWRKFKSEKLKAAIEEISEKTDIDVELIEHKKGRAVVEAQFKVRRVLKQAQLTDFEPISIDPGLLERVTAVGISADQLAPLVKAYGPDRVRTKLRELEMRIGSSGIQKVGSPLGYFKTILRSGDAPSVTVSETDASSGVSQAREVPEKPVSAVESISAARKEKFEAVQDRINNEFDALSSEERDEIAERAMQQFLASPICTPLQRQRIEQKRFNTPQFTAVIKNFFAQERYGAGWRDRLAAA